MNCFNSDLVISLVLWNISFSLFWNGTSCISSWPQTHYAEKNDLELVISLPLMPCITITGMCCNIWYIQPEDWSRTLCMLGKPCTDWSKLLELWTISCGQFTDMNSCVCSGIVSLDSLISKSTEKNLLFEQFPYSRIQRLYWFSLSLMTQERKWLETLELKPWVPFKDKGTG